MPARALSELQRLPTGTISDGSETNRVGVAANSNEITFWQGNVQISTRLLEGRYPDYKQLIPDHYPNRLHLGKESFLAALRRVQLLVRDNTTPVRLSMRQGGVDLSVQSQDVGDAAEAVDGDYTGEDLVIAFNPSYLDRRRRGGCRRRGHRRDSGRVAGGDGTRGRRSGFPLSPDAGPGLLSGARSR